MEIKIALLVIVSLFGLAIGSFITALVPRLKKKENFVSDRSRCPHCKHKLSPIELIPLLSYVIQGGKCKHCGKPISFFYPAVEFSTALVFVLTFLRIQDQINIYSTESVSKILAISILIGLFLSIFIFFGAYDVMYREVPDKISLPLIVILIVVNLILFSKTSASNSSLELLGFIKISPLSNLASGFAAAAFIAVLVILTGGKGMGGGDMRIAALIGLISGWKGTIVSFYLAFIVGSIVGLIMAARIGKIKGVKLPFVPFLSLGVILSFLFQAEIFRFIFPVLSI